jgi:hypothetical protein
LFFFQSGGRGVEVQISTKALFSLSLSLSGFLFLSLFNAQSGGGIWGFRDFFLYKIVIVKDNALSFYHVFCDFSRGMVWINGHISVTSVISHILFPEHLDMLNFNTLFI